MKFGILTSLTAALCTSVSTVALAAEPGLSNASVSCESLAALSLPNAKVTEAQTITDGIFKAPEAKEPLKNLPPFCRVHVVVNPAINIEIWMPLKGWNGRMVGVTGGGLLGFPIFAKTEYINGVNSLEDGVRRGFAMTSTDGGHTADPTDNWWNDMGRVMDFGYRAAHEMAVKSKIVTAAFYAQAPKRSYFSGCSGGGRVAMMEAQRYPEDFDGIIAGEPGANWTDLMISELWSVRSTTERPELNLPKSKTQMITDAAIAACDANDGLKDGIIGNPPACHFDPIVLQCKGADAPDCLTSGQVEAVRRLYSGPKFPDGRRIAYGLARGSETGWNTTYAGITDTNTQGGGSYATFVKRTVFGDPNYDLKTFDFNHDVDYMRGRIAAITDATNPDLSAFKARGGKLIEYYGWVDNLAPPEYTTSYYTEVQEEMGGATAVANFYRLFMGPGLGHCFGGMGPNKFDMGEAMINWVEKGIAPDSVLASRVDAKTGKTDMTRPLCPYPQTAHFTGSGSPNDAKNFYCANLK